MCKCRLMLVDDDASIREVLKEFAGCVLEGFEVVAEASNGREAVEKAAEVKPDIIVMDVRMPFMDGIQATRRIKRELGLDAVVITSTSYAWAEIREQAWGAGSRFYVRKPFDFEQLAEVLEAARDAAREGTQNVAQALPTAAYG